MEKERAALVKFGKYEHVLLLRDEGLLYMNNVPYFRKIEDEELRGDRNDSVDELYHGYRGYVEIKSPNGEKVSRANITDFELRVGPEEPERINLFCMYALRPEHGSYPIDKRNYKFGSHALVIFDVPEFLSRLSEKLKVEGIESRSGLVNYLSNRHSGAVGVFGKVMAFAYQSEWRLVCKNGPGKERTIAIGCLSDISEIFRADELNAQIKIYP